MNVDLFEPSIRATNSKVQPTFDIIQKWVESSRVYLPNRDHSGSNSVIIEVKSCAGLLSDTLHRLNQRY